MRKSSTSAGLAALFLLGVAGCKDDNQAAAAPSASVSPSAAVVPSASAPAPSTPATSSPAASTPAPSKTAGTSAAPAPAGKTFPLVITRLGGFAGVDDRATIAADGTAVVTRQGRAPVRTALPATTMAELRGLMKSPDFAPKGTPPTVCNDGYEYSFVSPSWRAFVQDCGASQGATLDTLLAVAGKVFNG